MIEYQPPREPSLKSSRVLRTGIHRLGIHSLGTGTSSSHHMLQISSGNGMERMDHNHSSFHPMSCLARLPENVEVPIGSPIDRMESLAYSRCTAIRHMSGTSGIPQCSLNVLKQHPVPREAASLNPDLSKKV